MHRDTVSAAQSDCSIRQRHHTLPVRAERVYGSGEREARLETRNSVTAAS